MICLPTGVLLVFTLVMLACVRPDYVASHKRGFITIGLSLMAVGVGLIYLPAILGDDGNGAFLISIFGAALVPSGAVTLLWSLRRQPKMREPGICVACDYNLTGNLSGVCPECGTPIEKNDAKP